MFENLMNIQILVIAFYNLYICALIAVLVIFYRRAIASVSRNTFPYKAFSGTRSVALRMGAIIEMTKRIIYFVFQLIKGKE